MPVTKLYQDLTQAGWVMLVLPFCYMRTVTGLKHTSVLSVMSVLVLGIAIGYRASTRLASKDPLVATRLGELPLATSDLMDLFTSIPITCVSFLCHFNVLPVLVSICWPFPFLWFLFVMIVVLFCVPF